MDGQEARKRRQGAGSRKQGAGGRRQEAGGRRQEAGGRRQKVGGRRPGIYINHKNLSKAAQWGSYKNLKAAQKLSIQ